MKGYIRFNTLQMAKILRKLHKPYLRNIWDGDSFRVDNCSISFALRYYDGAEDPWSVEIELVAIDHTTTAGCNRTATREEMMAYLENEDTLAQIEIRIKELVRNASHFYWP